MNGVVVPLDELIALRTRVPARPLREAAAMGMNGGRISARLGRGMEFAELRPYQAGDDVRHIDWRHTARHGAPCTKLFQEEHERPVHLLVDLGRSMRFGTRTAFKSVAAARAAALLAWHASACGECVGGIVCGGAHREVRPQSRHHGTLALLRHIADAAAEEPAADAAMEQSLRALSRTLRPGGMAMLVSDFADIGDGMVRDIAALAVRCGVTLVHVTDAFESEAPPPGIYPVNDGQRNALLDLRSEAARAAHIAPFAVRRAMLESLARLPRVRLLTLATHDDPASVLSGWLS
ncbi:DUF58 domain-containing protein [Herbaspirillum sp. HC18]|nr:DUF58 domain-containing protein [Herbaspirillum sp. HC18]